MSNLYDDPVFCLDIDGQKEKVDTFDEEERTRVQAYQALVASQGWRMFREELTVYRDKQVRELLCSPDMNSLMRLQAQARAFDEVLLWIEQITQESKVSTTAP